MAKKRFIDAFNDSIIAHRGLAVAMTAGGGLAGSRIVEGLSSTFSTMASRGDISAVGLTAGAVAGFLICASSLKL